jgi:hypothetical protein
MDGLKLRGAPLQTLVALWLCAKFDASTCRKLSPAIVSLPATPLEAYTALLEKLAPLSGTGSVPEVARRETRALFETALTEHSSQAVELWLRYVRWLFACAEFSEASATHARALRCLVPELRAAFVESHDRGF